MPVDKLELLKRAKSYMELLAQGTDPVTGQALSREDPMGSERMGRCFSFVAGTLEEVIAQREGGARPAREETEKAPRKKRAQKMVFSITGEQLESVAVTAAPVNMTEMARRLNEAAGLEKSDLNSRLLSYGLEKLGFLEAREGADGKIHRSPTAAGYETGLERLRCVNAVGQPYLLNVLTDAGQRFLLDNLDPLLDAGRRLKAEQEAQRARQKAERKAEEARRLVEKEDTE